MMRIRARTIHIGPAIVATAMVALAGCEQLDLDLRRGAADTTEAARTAAAPPPAPDSRGVISYPGYKVVQARRGETVRDIAARLDLSAGALSELNGIGADVALREGEVIALPEGALGDGYDAGARTGGVDITALAETALADGAEDRAPTGQSATGTRAQPVRHRVEPGETAYSIARLYDVSVSALAEWNGLGPDLDVREGQVLLIPLPAGNVDAAPAVSAPGTTSAVDAPPSAAAPLPREDPAEAAPQAALASPALGGGTDRGGNFVMPVKGDIIRPFQAGEFEGIDIAAGAGAPVRAADAGTVAIVTRDTEGIAIVAIDHGDNLLSVYANVGDITVAQGDRVDRGQNFATVAPGDPAFLHFEVRRGMDALDPAEFL